jgi:hypothetical protein
VTLWSRVDGIERSGALDLTSTTLVQLSAAGYLRDEQSVEQIDGPIFFRLGERALQRVAGWPGSSGDLAGELLALIDQRLEDPMVADDERGRLERLRATAQFLLDMCGLHSSASPCI